MTEFLFAAGQWLGLLLLLYGSCAVVTCAANEAREASTRFGPLTTHDWDAPDRGLRRERNQG